MLDNQRHKLLYDVHGWLGLVTGLLLYLICLSGAVALFAQPIADWTRPPATITAPTNASLDQVLATLVEQGIELNGEWKIHWPDATQPGFVFQPHDRARESLLVVPGAKVAMPAEPVSALARFVRELHTRLLLGRAGRYLLGVMGVVMFVSLVIGVLIHPKMLRELFVFRRGRSLRLALTDLHKLLGSWSLPFTLLISFTGALLGLAQLLLLVGAMANYRGELGRAVADYEGANIAAAGVTAVMPAIAPFIASAHASYPDSDMHAVTLHHWGDRNAQIEIAVTPRHSLIMAETVRYAALSGAVIHRLPIAGQGVWHRLYGAIVPLHYATFGGMLIKFLYAVLALMTAAMILSGLLIWLERRAANSMTETGSARVMSGLTMSIGAGAPVAYAMLFLLTAVNSALTLPQLLPLFLMTCVLTGVMMTRAPWRRLRPLLYLCASALLAAAGVQALRAQTLHGVGFTLAVLAFVLIYGAHRLPLKLSQPRGDDGRRAVAQATN